jgi:hypothetical protein
VRAGVALQLQHTHLSAMQWVMLLDHCHPAASDLTSHVQVFAEDERVAQLPPGRFQDTLAAVQRANAAQIAGTILTQMQATLRAKQQVGTC